MDKRRMDKVGGEEEEGEMYGKSNIEIYNTICKTNSQWKFDVWQKPSQYCKVISLQFKKNNNKKKSQVPLAPTQDILKGHSSSKIPWGKLSPCDCILALLLFYPVPLPDFPGYDPKDMP